MLLQMLDAFEHKLTGSVFFTHLRLVRELPGTASASMSAKPKRTRTFGYAHSRKKLRGDTK
jgi:hypothetical protein